MSTHVLLISHAYPPDSSAGTERYTARLARGLQARGWRVTVLTGRLRPGRAQYTVERSEIDGVDVLGVVQNWPYRDLPEATDDPALDRVFARLLDELAPDLVAIQTLHGLSWGFVDVAAEAGIPVVLHLHDGGIVCPAGGQRRHPDGSLCMPVEPARCGACFDTFRHREGPLERWSRAAAARLPGAVPPDTLHRAFTALPGPARAAMKRANERGAQWLGRLRSREPAVGVDPRIAERRARMQEVLGRCALAVSPSRFLAQSLEADGVPLPPWQVVPTGVDGTASPPPPAPPLRVLFLGTFVEHKGPQILADALAGLSEDEAAGIVARAVGPAPFPAWRDALQDRSRGRLRIEGPVPAAEVPALLAAHHVLVVPSLWAENAPLVVLEARAAGRIVVASDLGGLVELVEDPSLRFPAGDADALAAILRGLPERRAGLTVAPPRSIDAWAAAMIAVWTPLLRSDP